MDVDHILEIANDLKALGIGASLLKLAQWLFSIKPGDIDPCTTRIMRTQRGLPWDEQIGAHPLKDGRLVLTPIREDEADGGEPGTLTEAQFYGALGRVSRRVTDPEAESA